MRLEHLLRSETLMLPLPHTHRSPSLVRLASLNRLACYGVWFVVLLRCLYPDWLAWIGRSVAKPDSVTRGHHLRVRS